MSTPPPAANFEALDECHQQIQAHLRDLDGLARQLEQDDVDAHWKQRALAIDAFFSDIARQHHAEEEKTVFPLVLKSGNEQLVAAVQSLQQDHGWIEIDWVELSPQLLAIGTGTTWPGTTEFRNEVDVFIALYRDHIALEETLIYPESKARWAQVVQARKLHPPR